MKRKAASKQTAVNYRDHTVFLSGELDFSNAMQIYQQSLAYIQPLSSLSANNKLNIDFSAVTMSNSVGLALIIEWIKLAKQYHFSIQFSYLSTKLMEIAKAAGAECLLE